MLHLDICFSIQLLKLQVEITSFRRFGTAITIPNTIGYITKHYLFNIYNLAAVGGMMGLLLGASVITLVEFLDFLISFLKMKWSENKVITIN